MAKNSITDYSTTAASNTDIQSVDIDEACAPSGINNAIRELMVDLARVNAGTDALTSLVLGTNGYDVTPGSDIDADLITVNVTGTPKVFWDESADAFSLNKGAILTAGDLTVSGGDLSVSGAVTAGSSDALFDAQTVVQIVGASGSAAQGGLIDGADDFAIYNDGGVGVSLQTTTTGQVTIAMGDNLDSDSGAIIYNNNGTYMAFTSNAVEAMRLDSNQNVSIPNGGISINGGTDVLDAYVESTFTPAFADAASGGNEASVASANGRKVIIGALVTIWVEVVNINTTGLTGSNTAYLTGLGTTMVSSTMDVAVGSCVLDRVSFGAFVSPIVTQNTSYLTFTEMATGAADAPIKVNDFTSGTSDFYVTISYEVA